MWSRYTYPPPLPLWFIHLSGCSIPAVSPRTDEVQVYPPPTPHPIHQPHPSSLVHSPVRVQRFRCTHPNPHILSNSPTPSHWFIHLSKCSIPAVSSRADEVQVYPTPPPHPIHQPHPLPLVHPPVRVQHPSSVTTYG